MQGSKLSAIFYNALQFADDGYSLDLEITQKGMAVIALDGRFMLIQTIKQDKIQLPIGIYSLHIDDVKLASRIFDKERAFINISLSGEDNAIVITSPGLSASIRLIEPRKITKGWKDIAIGTPSDHSTISLEFIKKLAKIKLPMVEEKTKAKKDLAFAFHLSKSQACLAISRPNMDPYSAIVVFMPMADTEEFKPFKTLADIDY